MVSRRLPVRLQLLVDVVLIALFFALDARDLVFKTLWLGPENTFSFSATTGTLHLDRKPLTTAPNDGVSAHPQQLSGWPSFVQKCKSLHALQRADEVPSFSHVVARGCELGRRGRKHTAAELVLTSSVRVDSVAWAACKMLYHHRKPPVCHSPVVRFFGHRYNMDDKPSLVCVDLSSGVVGAVPSVDIPGSYSAAPGSDAEMEIIELLNVIGKSSPISRVVCVEGFFPTQGPGFYTASLFGCASPTSNHSSFVGHLASGFEQFHQDKAWLTADVLHISGMTYMIRENRRSVFEVKGALSDGSMTLEHRTLLNFSSSGALYTIATGIDLVLLLIHVYSAMEIIKLMIRPLWKSLASKDNVVSRSTSKAAFTAEDCQAVLTASLYRSKPIVLLIVVGDVLHWMIVGPTGIVLSEQGISSSVRLHALLSTFRFWVLVLLVLHVLWDAFVAWFEKRAFTIVHGTYVTIGEVATIAGIVGYLRRSTIFSLHKSKYELEGQRFVDATSFVGRVAVSNAFPEHHDSLQNTSAAVVSLMYMPLVVTIIWSLVAIACFVSVRFVYFKFRDPDSSNHPHSRYLVNRPSAKFMVKPELDTDATGSPCANSMPPSPPGAPRQGSPKRPASDMSGEGVMPTSGHAFALRLPLEKVVDVPIRARSLVRNGWKMEKKVGHRIFLRPPQYLEHGIILQGGCLKTRFGFTDIVHPYLRAGNHVMPDDEGSHRSSSSGSSSPRRSSSSDKLQRDSHTLRLPLVPLR